MASDLIVKIGGDTEDVKASLEGLGEKIAEMIGEINPIAGAAVTAVAGIGLAAIDAGENFESFYNTIIQRTGATGEELTGLKESFDSVFSDVPVDGGKLAESLSLISQRLHLTSEDLTAFAEQVSKLSLVTGEDLKTQTDAITKAFLNWSISTEDQKGKLDELYAISQQTGVSVTTLAGTIASVGVGARLAGEDFDQTAQKIAYLSSQGIDAEAVYTALARVQANLIKSGSDTKATLDDLIYTINNSTTANQALEKAVDVLGPKLGPKLAELISEGKLSVDGLNTAIGNTKTTIESTYAATETFGEKLTTFWHNVEAVLEPIGSFAVEKGKGFLDWLNLAAYAATGNTDAFNKLNAEINKVATGTGEATRAGINDNQTKQESIAAAKSYSQALIDEGLGMTITVTGAKASGTAHHDLAAEMAAAKAVAEALTHVQELLAKADSDHAEMLKSVYVPTITDVQTAESNLADARADYMAKDATEQALRAQLATASGGAVIAIEAQIKQASADSAAARLAYTEAEKTLTASKSDAVAVSQLLLAAEHALSEEAKATHIPTLMSMADADAAVSAAQADLTEKTQALLDARESLTSWQQGHGNQDAATEKQLKDDVTAAIKAETDAINVEKQAVSDRSVVARVGQQLDQDIFNGQKQLNDFYKSQVIPTYSDLQSSLDKIQVAKEAEKSSADALAVAIANETAVRKNETSTEADANTAKAATKAAEDNLKASTEQVNIVEAEAIRNHGLNKAALDLLPPSINGVTSAHANLEAAIASLGLKSTDTYAKMATSADEAYKLILASGTTNSELLRTAQIADIQAQIDQYKSMGQDVPASQQILFTTLKQQEKDYQSNSVSGWSTMWTSIHDSATGFFADLNKDIVSGDFSKFHDQSIKMLEDIGNAVLTKFTKPATDAIASFISGSITSLLSGQGLGGIMDQLDKIGTSMSKIFTGTSGALGTGVGVAGSTGSTVAGTAGSAGSTAASGAGSAGSAAGTAGSTLGTVATGIGIVTGVVSAGADVYNAALLTNIKDHLATIQNSTTVVAQAIDEGGMRDALSTLKNDFSAFSYGGFSGWFKGILDDNSSLFYEMNDRQKFEAASLDHIDTATAQMALSIPAAINTLANTPIVVNVKTYLDSKEISSAVQTDIENNLKLATA